MADKLPCGCANHDGGPYAPGCAALSDAEPSVYAEIVDHALNDVQADSNIEQRTIPEGWQHAIPVIINAADLLAALEELAFRAERHGMNADQARAAIARAKAEGRG